jgi:glycosyltransferase involved in cell wall biosynthesis
MRTPASDLAPVSERLAPLRIGWAPFRTDYSHPGDRRRFGYYARHRGVEFERARPDGDYDIVIVSSTADLVWWSKQSRARVVFDLIDPYLDVPDLQLKAALRGTAKYAVGELSRPVLSYRRLVARTCRHAAAVVVTSTDQRRAALAQNPNVHVIVDAHDDATGPVKGDYATGRPLALVWEGLGVNLKYLAAVRPALQALHAEQPLELHIATNLSYPRWLNRFGHRSASADAESAAGVPVKAYEWSERTLPWIAAACDIAIIPLSLDDPFTRGKSAQKLFWFWRWGVPTLTSATPAYAEAMDAAGCGLGLVHRPEDWSAALRRVVRDAELRASLGRSGYEYTLREMSRERILERWDKVFRSVLPPEE